MTQLVAVVGLGPVRRDAGDPARPRRRADDRIERGADVFPLSRAVALDDEALRVLQAAGVAAGTLPALLTQQTVRFRSPARGAAP